jgi:hypothetical protein
MHIGIDPKALDDFRNELISAMTRHIENPRLAQSITPIVARDDDMGVFVVRTRNPELVRSIDSMPSASLDPAPSRCRHQQAEPVALVTGEIVATICIECLSGLPADYIDKQRSTAERQAYCEHDFERLLERSVSGEITVDYASCSLCGARK